MSKSPTGAAGTPSCASTWRRRRCTRTPSSSFAWATSTRCSTRTPSSPPARSTSRSRPQQGRRRRDPDGRRPPPRGSAYIQRLLEQGFKVAICEQMADPSKVKGIVPREVVRVVTPGMVTDDDRLDARANHYLAAVERDAGRGGLRRRGARPLHGRAPASRPKTPGRARRELARPSRARSSSRPRRAPLAKDLHALRPRDDVRAATRPIDAAAARRRARRRPRPGRGARRLPRSRCEPRRARVTAARALHAGQAAAHRAPRRLHARRHARPRRDHPGAPRARAHHGRRERGVAPRRVDATGPPVGARLLRRRLLAPLIGVHEIRGASTRSSSSSTQPRPPRRLRDALGGVGDLERLAVKRATELRGRRASSGPAPLLAGAAGARRRSRSVPDTAARARSASRTGKWIDACDDVPALLARAGRRPSAAARQRGRGHPRGLRRALDEVRDAEKDGQRLIVELEAGLRESAQIPSLKLATSASSAGTSR